MFTILFFQGVVDFMCQKIQEILESDDFKQKFLEIVSGDEPPYSSSVDQMMLLLKEALLQAMAIEYPSVD